jgi:ATP-binding cassette subfamily B protein
MAPDFSPVASDQYDSRRPIRTLFHLAGQPWWRYAAIVLLFAAKHTPQVLLPVAMGFIIDELSRSRYVFAEPWFVVTAAVVLLQNIPSHIAFTALMSSALRRLEWRLRALVVHRLQQLSLTFHDNAQSGRLQAKVLRDVEQIFTMCQVASTTVLVAAFTLVFAMVNTMIKTPEVALFFLLAVPLAVWFDRAFRRPLMEKQHAFRAGVEAMSARMAEMVEMIPITRAHGVEAQEIDSINEHLGTVFLRGRQLDLFTGAFQALLWVSVIAVNLSATAFAGYLSWRGRISLGDVVMYSAFYQMLLGSVQMLLGVIPAVTQGVESIRSIDEVLACPDLEQNEGKARVDRVEGSLAFEGVSFTYPGSREPAVSDFSLTIAPGECVAFVGESGSGKSTLMSLAIGFVRPTAGRILLDGRDMEELDLRGYRDFLAVVPQRVVLMSASIRANVTYGFDEPLDDRRVREALEAANAMEFIEPLPDGLDTVIGERGAKLSGGQAQRISVARALIRDPRVIILDEATSALDVMSEALVQEALERLMKHRTTLIVAHRLSTVRKATRIVVMKGGRCLETGSPAELLASKGAFHAFHALQEGLR